MEQFLFYLLRASVLMALFYGFYKLFFGKNTFHHFNRFSLILIVMLVAVLPVFRFNLIPEKKVESVVIENFPMDFSNIPIVEISELPVQPIQIPWIEILSVVFAVGFLFALVRYLIGLNQLKNIIRKSEKQTLADDTVLCIADNDISPFSWMKYIVISRKDVTADNRAIINHERAHVHLLHSLDMIFFDLFTCAFWFNPFSWLLRREIQSVHEYQADDKVIQNGIDAKQYQLLLIRKSVGEHKFALANNFRQRDLHKRITMMMKTKSNKRMKWNYTVALPVLFLAMVALSVPKLKAKVVEKEVENSSENEIITTQTGDSVIIADASIDLTKNPLELGKVRILPKDSLNFVISFEEKLTVSGFVKGKDGFMPGVAVLIKGSANGAITDIEGKFVIQTDKDDVLQFMMVGYKLFEYKVEKAVNNLVVSLQPEEVLVVGSGKTEDFEIEKDNNQKSKIIIRGASVIPSHPLLILDGKEIASLNGVKPDDIESISVLKSKSAVELYGEKGKDGVILITTKKGADAERKGEVVISTNKLSLRGVSDDKKPLIVVDGEVKGKDFELNSISPSDIESMSVFKDKVALDMYGEEGKNGVVQIMTKENLKIKISIDSKSGEHTGVNVYKTGEVMTFGNFDNTDIFINGKKSTEEDVKRLHSKNVNSLIAWPASLDYESGLHKKYNVPKNRNVIEIR